MKYQLAKTRIQTLLQQRNSAWVLLVLLVFVCVTQSLGLIYLGMLNHYGKVIERPIGLNTSFWIDAHEVSPSYIAGMARYLTQLYLTVSPKNFKAQRNAFLRQVSPNSYPIVKQELLKLDNTLNNQDITSAFYPNQIQVDPEKLEAKVTGQLEIRASNAKAMTKMQAYILKFTYHYGSLQLKAFQEVKS